MDQVVLNTDTRPISIYSKFDKNKKYEIRNIPIPTLLLDC